MRPIFKIIFCEKCTCKSHEQCTGYTIFQLNANA